MLKKTGNNSAELLVTVCTTQEQVFNSLSYPLQTTRLSICFQKLTHDISTYISALRSLITNIYTDFNPSTSNVILINQY
jgi:hypothetical protein